MRPARYVGPRPGQNQRKRRRPSTLRGPLAALGRGAPRYLDRGGGAVLNRKEGRRGPLAQIPPPAPTGARKLGGSGLKGGAAKTPPHPAACEGFREMPSLRGLPASILRPPAPGRAVSRGSAAPSAGWGPCAAAQEFRRLTL
ncbi:unnamed protein product [Amoebophrya sp. A120]|nr:unnamed protein product [Amoebophrya sp. A120]|eukprot:GSA120T00009255001.1